MKEQISYADFTKLDLRVGTVLEAEKIEGSDKLLALTVSLGDDRRKIIAGIGTRYDPDDIVSKQIIIVANLAPRQIMGQTSEGMILAGGTDKPIILIPEDSLLDGSTIH